MALTLAKAQENLDLWIAASEALASGQAYTIGSRSLTRSNANEVLKMIDYWQNKVTQIEAAGGDASKVGGGRIMRIVPRDL